MICIDGQYAEGMDKLPVSWLDAEGFLFGIGVFETLRVVSGEPEDLEAHLYRLQKSAAALGIAIPEVFTDLEALNQLLTPLLRESDNYFTVLKICLIKHKAESHWWAQLRPFTYNKDQVASGLKVNLSAVKRNSSSLLVSHKSMNYAENWLEKQKSVENGYQEVLFLNEDGYLTEGAVSNLFVIKDGIWHTPALSCGILNGVMRQRLIAAIEKQNGTIEEGHYELAFLKEADYVMLTNSLMGILPVKQVGEIAFEAPSAELTAFLEQVDPERLNFE